eukprot:5465273-Pleurochrysis_carterae.AAC.2
MRQVREWRIKASIGYSRAVRGVKIERLNVATMSMAAVCNFQHRLRLQSAACGRAYEARYVACVLSCVVPCHHSHGAQGGQTQHAARRVLCVAGEPGLFEHDARL